MNEIKVVVVIDFGTSGTSYAFSYNNPKDIRVGRFINQGVESKVPTQVILDSKLEKVLAFGNECDNYISSNGLFKNGELFFRKIKMNIYKGVHMIKPQNNSREYPLEDVISKILEYIKEQSFKTIQDSNPKITIEQIKYVVTVPAIWDLSMKGIMIRASEKAGLLNQKTDILNFFALEPEAASMQCLEEGEEKTIDQDCFNPGHSYIICDLGGGTGDIVTHCIDIDGNIIEKYPPIGGNYGSDEIDKEIFEKVLYELFGFKDYNSLEKKNNEIEKNQWEEESLFYEWEKLQEEIQKKKKITENLKDKDFLVNCQIFENFVDQNLKEIVEDYNSRCDERWKVTIKNEKIWLLSFPYNIFFDLIEEHSKKIIEQLNNIFEKVQGIDGILYVGGYISNDILFNNIKKNFNLLHIRPSPPEIAVVKGAVLFGLNPDKIKIRIFPYTLGFNCDDFWDENIHGGKGTKYANEIDKSFLCLNSFHTFIKMGEAIPKNHSITHNFFTLNSRNLIIKFFKTQKNNPILWTEDGIELIGSDTIDLQKDYSIYERGLSVTLKFGGTYVEAKCIHYGSKIETNLVLYFNK